MKVWFYTSIATSVSAFAGNVLLIWVVYKAVMLRTTSNYFIVNIAISDMFLPAVNLFIVIFFDRKVPGNLSGPVGTVLCKFLSFFFYLSYGVSMFSLLVVTVHGQILCSSISHESQSAEQKNTSYAFDLLLADINCYVQPGAYV